MEILASGEKPGAEAEALGTHVKPPIRRLVVLAALLLNIE